MNNLVLIAQKFQELNIQSYLVGGTVRDELLRVPCDDIDICLVGVTNKSQVMEVLSSLNFILSVAQEVGESFPVWIADIKGIGKVDFALARGEKKTGPTRQDFVCTTQGVTIEEDLLRRDLTINSIAKNVLDGTFVDPYNGIQHLKDRIAHPVSNAFKEDSLRVLRAARFCSRYELTPSKELLELCKGLTPTDISNERVGMEVYKTMKQAIKPSIFFYFLKEVNWLGYYFKEVEDLFDIPQSPIYHPETNAGIHSMLCLDQATDVFTRVTMLLHDVGKSVTTTISESGKIQALGHEEAGVPLARQLMQRIFLLDKKFQDQVCLMVELHMIHSLTISEKIIRRTLRRLMDNGLTYNQLVEVCRCDVSGRDPLPHYTPDIGQTRAQELLDQDLMTPIVTGKLLMSLGLTPGKFMGEFIKKALELQDRGTLTKENWKGVMKGAGFPL
jgi:tRNA nucleotidyltransferase (CCA-adding enzyme)